MDAVEGYVKLREDQFNTITDLAIVIMSLIIVGSALIVLK